MITVANVYSDEESATQSKPLLTSDKSGSQASLEFYKRVSTNQEKPNEENKLKMSDLLMQREALNEGSVHEFSRGFTMMQRRFEKKNISREARIHKSDIDQCMMFKERETIVMEAEMHKVHDQNAIGFTKRDREKKIYRLQIELILISLLFLDTLQLIVYSLYLNKKSEENEGDDGNFQHEMLIVLFFGGFSAIFLCRMIKCIYLIRKWKNLAINPTLIEAKIQFYSFFTLGLIEIILQIAGFIVIRKFDFIYSYI